MRRTAITTKPWILCGWIVFVSNGKSMGIWGLHRICFLFFEVPWSKSKQRYQQAQQANHYCHCQNVSFCYFLAGSGHCVPFSQSPPSSLHHGFIASCNYILNQRFKQQGAHWSTRAWCPPEKTQHQPTKTRAEITRHFAPTCCSGTKSSSWKLLHNSRTQTCDAWQVPAPKLCRKKASGRLETARQVMQMKYIYMYVLLAKCCKATAQPCFFAQGSARGRRGGPTRGRSRVKRSVWLEETQCGALYKLCLEHHPT